MQRKIQLPCWIHIVLPSHLLQWCMVELSWVFCEDVITHSEPADTILFVLLAFWVTSVNLQIRLDLTWILCKNFTKHINIITVGFSSEVRNSSTILILNCWWSRSAGSNPRQLGSHSSHAHLTHRPLFSWFYKLSFTARVPHFSRGILNILPVYVLNIKHVCGLGGPGTLRQSQPSGGWQNSQMAPTGQRTIPADAPKATGVECSTPALHFHPPLRVITSLPATSILQASTCSFVMSVCLPHVL